ncbi:MAG: hypothetical protein OEW43_07075 [Elusimicrobiota bacterium]|nr:hypothetical protein [Elusimicrobiota bacterium]MDH5662010.1 hypothetical protein [Elusimicrobiota bacterium]
MVEEEPKDDDKSKKKEIELSHPLVNEVLSKISEIEKKEKKEEKEEERETPQEKFLGEEEAEIPRKAKRSLKKISFVMKTFSILTILFFAGWYLMAKRFPIKSWVANRFSTLTSKIMKEKDSVWIKRKITGTRKGRELPAVTRKIREDVKGIPVYMGARQVSTSGQDNVSTINFTTSDSMDRVVPFYLEEMESKGYGLVKADYWPGAEIGQLFFSKDGKDCTVSLVENETGGVNVAISYTE